MKRRERRPRIETSSSHCQLEQLGSFQSACLHTVKAHSHTSHASPAHHSNEMNLPAMARCGLSRLDIGYRYRYIDCLLSSSQGCCCTRLLARAVSLASAACTRTVRPVDRRCRQRPPKTRSNLVCSSFPGKSPVCAHLPLPCL